MSRTLRCAGWATWSATIEHPTQPCSGQPATPGSMNARYTIELAAAVEQVEQAHLPVGPLELVLLLHLDPRHAPAGGGHGVTGAGQLPLLGVELW